MEREIDIEFEIVIEEPVEDATAYYDFMGW